MSQQNDIRVQVGAAVDKNSIKQARDSFESIADSARENAEQVKKSGSDVDSLTASLRKIKREDSLKDLATSAVDLAKATDDTEGALKQLDKVLQDVGANDKEVEKVIRQFEKLRNTVDDIKPPPLDPQESIRKRQFEFADQSGDRASIAGLTRGAIDELSGGAAAPVTNALAGAEAIFDLGEAAGKLGGPVGKAVTAIGPAGLAGAAGVAGVALAAGAIAFNEYAKRAERAREVQRAFTETLRETIGLLNSEQGTSDAVAERRQEIEKEIENAQRSVEALKQVREARNEENNAIQDIFTQSRVLAGGTRKQLNEDITQAENDLRSASASLEAFELTLNESEIAANDAAEAERLLAQERSTAALETARQAGELEAARQRFADSTREQIQAELDSIEARKASLQAELASLQASGQETEEVQNKIANLTSELEFLGVKSQELASIQAGARTQESVDREKALESARQASARATDDAFQAELELAQEGTRKLAERKKAEAEAEKEVEKAREESRKKRLERATRSRDRSSSRTSGAASTSETQSLQDEFRRLQNDRIRVENDAEEQRINQVIDNNRRLQDIARNFGDSRADALEEGNFLALEQINKEEKRAKRDQRIDNQRANEDIRRDNQNALREIQNQEQQLANQRIQANAAVIQGTQQLLRIAQQFRGAIASFDSASRSGRSFSQAQEQRLGLRSTNASRPITS